MDQIVDGVRLLSCIGRDTFAGEFGRGSSACVERLSPDISAQELSIRSALRQPLSFYFFKKAQLTCALPSWSGRRLVYNGNVASTPVDAMHSFVSVVTMPQGYERAENIASEDQSLFPPFFTTLFYTFFHFFHFFPPFLHPFSHPFFPPFFSTLFFHLFFPSFFHTLFFTPFFFTPFFSHPFFHPFFPPFFSFFPPLCSTDLFHPFVPPLCSTPLFHPFVPPLCSTSLFHLLVPPPCSTSLFHLLVPPPCSTSCFTSCFTSLHFFSPLFTSL